MLPLSQEGKGIFPILKETGKLNGVSLDIHQSLEELPSVMILEKFSELANIQGIAFIGSSASGKSTLIKQIRSAFAESKDIDIPTRCVTRPPRPDDDLTENRYLSVADFKEGEENGTIPISWIRKMGGNRIELYGFEKTDSQKLALYSANNDFFRTISQANRMMEEIGVEKDNLDEEQLLINKRIATLSKTLLILGVYAPDEVRKARLYARSPGLATSEKEYRIGDSSDNIIPYCHILVKNYAAAEQNALNDVVNLVKIIVAKRVRWGEIRDLGNHRVQYRSRLFDIVNHEVLFSDGMIKTFEYVERSPGVRTLVTDGHAILITKEWRQELGQWDFRLPGGKVFENIKDFKRFKEENSDKELLIEEARKAAHKETLEEVGINVNSDGLQLEHISNCGAVMNWDLYYFSALVNNGVSEQSNVITAENEMIINTWLSLAEVRELCLSGQISEDRTSNFILKYINNRQK